MLVVAALDWKEKQAKHLGQCTGRCAVLLGGQVWWWGTQAGDVDTEQAGVPFRMTCRQWRPPSSTDGGATVWLLCSSTLGT